MLSIEIINDEGVKVSAEEYKNIRRFKMEIRKAVNEKKPGTTIIVKNTSRGFKSKVTQFNLQNVIRNVIR